MIRKILILSLVLIMFLTVSCTVEESSDNKPATEPLIPIADESQVEDENIEEPAIEEVFNVKEFKMTAKKWEFIPDTITVNEGDTVKLEIESIDVTHGFGLSAFGINENLNAGETVNIEFVADKKGEFKFFCSVFCGSGHSQMDGKIIVE